MGASSSVGGASSTSEYKLTYCEGSSDENKPTTLPWIGRDRITSISKLDIDNFDIRCTIGSGVAGTVKLVQSKSNDFYYVLKCMDKQQAISDKTIKYMKSEKSILNKINSEVDCKSAFFVDLLGTFQDTKTVFFVMDYIPGGELLNLVYRNNRLADECAKFYACEVFSALEYLHENGVMYRDLKLENILLNKNGHIKLCDFGFAKDLGNYARAFSRVGTPHCMSPEVLDMNMKGGYDYSCDWWAFGCFLYEMLVGKSAWGLATDSTESVLNTILSGKFSVPRYLKKDSKDLIKALLKPNLQNRLCDAPRIKSHQWFTGINWEKVRDCRVLPPIVPEIQQVGDRANFQPFDEDTINTAAELPEEQQKLFRVF